MTKTWFITGTSRGFGRVWTEAALGRGDRVVATARDTSALDDLVSQYGFADDARTLQELYLGGKQLEAIRRVPDALVDAISIAGPASYVRERLEVWASAGVTTMVASVHGKTQPDRLRTLEILAAAAGAAD